MAHFAKCRYCGESFGAMRSDHYFCCAAHVAAYYRENPNPEYIHAEKAHTNRHYCENCGVPFDVNDYAQRGGKRAPKYCSVKCKQAAYRQRQKGEPQPQAKRRYDGNASNDGKSQRQNASGQSGHKTRENAGKGHSGAKSGHSGGSSEFWRGATNKRAAAMKILGLIEGFTANQLRVAWIREIKAHHPDVSKSVDATWETQQINWAYEYLSE